MDRCIYRIVSYMCMHVAIVFLGVLSTCYILYVCRLFFQLFQCLIIHVQCSLFHSGFCFGRLWLILFQHVSSDIHVHLLLSHVMPLRATPLGLYKSNKITAGLSILTNQNDRTFNPGLWLADFQVWMCGGQVLIATCSRVGHVFRKVSPYSWPGGVVKILNHNTLRTVNVWMDQHKEFYYKITPGVEPKLLIQSLVQYTSVQY